MASIILSAAASAVGSATGLPYGAAIGARFGQAVGRIVDSTLLSPGQKCNVVRGPRLTELGVQTSTYGKMIPIVYGTVRIGGNIIWSRPIKETVVTSTSSASGGKGGGGKVTQTTTSYSYSVTLAIAICEGPLDEVLRIWADAKQLDMSQYTLRIYKGDETQLPDSIIQAYDGTDNVPAYRGLAYAVFEDFPLGEFGNRIPNFTFEVRKRAAYPDYGDETLEEMITGITLIPGSGEYVYDTQVEYKIPGAQVGADWVQQGNQVTINMHNASGQANVLLALDQLQGTLPNVEWVSVVVTWFGDTLDAGTCVVKPGVEYQTGATTSPEVWQSGSFTRATARQITLVGGSPQYGGTPDDNSVLRLLDELNDRGYNIMFYPMMFMDMTGKPWRGELTGSASDVSSFFTKTDGYNAFITHYANLVNGKVDAFVIGSELKGLTKVTDTPGNYPAVNRLVTLAGTVRGILGGSVKLTYAADWSEYHHTDGGWYNLDPLWASSDIDMIGIDAYFPLSDVPQSGYDIDAIKAGWTSGEGYDWYYTDPARTTQASLSPPYAWKDIEWFWDNTHTNPDASTTAWTSQMKNIWFTEYGFPSVDGAANQPNVFYDPTSSSSAFPYHSKGRVDFRAQRAGLTATQQQWKDSAMVERMFVWTWDARPYPYWPDLTSIWSDGSAWKTGHWVQGKLGVSSLAAIVSDVCQRTGLTDADIDVTGITDQVEGYVLTHPQTAREAVETLQQGYFFDATESDNVLAFVPRGGTAVASVTEDELIPVPGKDNGEAFKIARAQEIELPQRINIIYLNRMLNYQTSTQHSQREATSSREIATSDLPIVLSDQAAKIIADVRLFTDWVSRTTYQFDLPVKYAFLEPADVITVTVSGVAHRMRITSVRVGTPVTLRIQGVAEEVSTYDFYTPPGNSSPLLSENGNIPETRLDLLDIAAFPGDDADKGVLRMAAAGLSAGWTGAAIYRSDDGGGNYGRISEVTTPAVTGTASDVLGSGVTTVFDEQNTVTVVLIGEGELQSVSELAALNGANAALLGNEIIQYKTATLVEPGKYTLSGLLRGRLGTEWAVAGHAAGERFVLLDGRIARQTVGNSVLGLTRQYKPVTFGGTLASTPSQDFSYAGVALKPYSPVHIGGTRDGGGNLTISWVRRTRLGGNWQDAIDAPLNETAEAYEVDIMNGANVVRTLAGLASPSAAYTAAQQTTDFGSPQASISVKVYQVSGMIGRGYAGVAAV
jgi:hypothetical protein